VARTSQARIFRSTQTAPNAGTVRDLATGFGSSANQATVAAFPLAGASAFRFSPNTSGDSGVAPPAIDTAASGKGWRDVVAEQTGTSLTFTYAAGTWSALIRLNKTVMTVNASVTVRVTMIFYQVTTSGTHVSEIGRIVFADTALPTVGAVVAVTGSFVTGAPTVLSTTNKIQIECYVENIVAGAPAPAVAAYTVAYVVDEASPNGAALTAQPDYTIQYSRSNAEAIALTDSLSRQVAYKRTNSETIPLTESVTRKVGNVRSLAESVPIGADTLGRVVAFKRSMTESIALTDLLSRQTVYGRSLAESIPLTDSMTRQVGYSRINTEDLAAGGGDVTIVKKIFPVFDE
jgi:hypothetical protein